MMKDRLKSIENRWVPNDGFGIGHPIHEDELEDDIRYLVQLIKDHKKEIKELKTDLFYMTRRANCNCVSYDEFMELEEELHKLAKELGIQYD